jgi:hypothetical protein
MSNKALTIKMQRSPTSLHSRFCNTKETLAGTVMFFLVLMSITSHASEKRKFSIILGNQFGVNPFSEIELHYTPALSIGLITYKKSVFGLNISRFSSNAEITLQNIYLDSRVNIGQYHPFNVRYISFSSTIKSTSFGLFYMRHCENKHFNSSIVANINIMKPHYLYDKSIYPFSKEFTIDTPILFDFQIKYLFYSTNTLFMKVGIGPVFRLSNLKITSAEYFERDGFNSIHKVISNPQNLYFAGIAFDFIFFYKEDIKTDNK